MSCSRPWGPPAPSAPSGPAERPKDPEKPLFEIEDLSVWFGQGSQRLPVLEQFTLQVRQQEAVALVGESGCGKTVAMRAALRLLPSPPAEISAVALRLAGASLLGRTPAELSRIWGRQVGYVLQEALSALNPVVRIGVQLCEGPRRHLGLSRPAARELAIDLLQQVGITDPSSRLSCFPHQLSGGMRQRVLLAAALSCDPPLLVADEPTTALDVTVQAQILGLLDELRHRRNLALLLITHDLGVVAELADQVVVVYAGQVVEVAPVVELFEEPFHPYTEALLAALPRRAAVGLATGRRSQGLPGQVPAPGYWPRGCRFANRCTRVLPSCHEQPIPLVATSPGRQVRCLRAGEG